jgi:hypothetical protein
MKMNCESEIVFILRLTSIVIAVVNYMGAAHENTEKTRAETKIVALKIKSEDKNIIKVKIRNK